MPRKNLKYVQVETSRHGETVFYFRRGTGERIRLPDTAGTPEFRAAYDAASAGEHPQVNRVAAYARRDKRMSFAMDRIIDGCRMRAEEKGRPFDLTVEWLTGLAKKQRHRCAVSGLPLDLKGAWLNKGRNPYAPSIDRIDSSGGYTKNNVRIVALAVNIMLADWGEDVLKRVAQSYLRNRD